MSLPRVLIADDPKLFAHGVATLLRDRFEIVGTIGDGSLLVDAVVRLNPNAVLLDISMPRMNGLDALAHLMAIRPDVRVVILTMHRDARLALEALRGGAAGFVLKESSGDELVAALDAVLHGQTFLTSTLTQGVMALTLGPVSPVTVKMTPRQHDVLRLLVQGQRISEIAVALELAPRSVESIKYQMMQELNVHSTAELVQYAIQNDLVPS